MSDILDSWFSASKEHSKKLNNLVKKDLKPSDIKKSASNIITETTFKHWNNDFIPENKKDPSLSDGMNEAKFILRVKEGIKNV